MRKLFIVMVCLLSRGTWADGGVIVPELTVEYADIISQSRAPLPKSADDSGIGSRFGDPGDQLIGGRMACAPHDFVNSVDHVCAHRFYPCGTILIIEYQKTGKRSWCVVTDRGPYGAYVMSGSGKPVLDSANKPKWFIKGKPSQVPSDDLCPDGGCTGQWRGVIDMSPAVSKAMDHPGMGYVKVWQLRRVVDFHKFLLSQGKNPIM